MRDVFKVATSIRDILETSTTEQGEKTDGDVRRLYVGKEVLALLL